MKLKLIAIAALIGLVVALGACSGKSVGQSSPPPSINSAAQAEAQGTEACYRELSAWLHVTDESNIDSIVGIYGYSSPEGTALYDAIRKYYQVHGQLGQNESVLAAERVLRQSCMNIGSHFHHEGYPQDFS